MTTKHLEDAIALHNNAPQPTPHHRNPRRHPAAKTTLLTMKLHIDKEADALYLRLGDSTIVESEEVAPGVVLDYNEADQVVGIEMLNLSKRSPNLNLSHAWNSSQPDLPTRPGSPQIRIPPPIIREPTASAREHPVFPIP